MTTKVMILSPQKGGKPIKVQVQGRTPSGEWTDTAVVEVLQAGECSHEYWVHDGCRLVIEEQEPI